MLTEPHRGRPEEGRGVPLRQPQERGQVRRRPERAARSRCTRRRREILEGEDLHESSLGWFEDVIEAAVDAHTGGRVRRGLGLGRHVGLLALDLPDRVGWRRSIASTSPARSCSTAPSTTRSRLRGAGAGVGRGADPQHRALDHPAGARRALARAPGQHGLHAPGHRPARLRPERPAGRVQGRGRGHVQRDERAGQAGDRARLMHAQVEVEPRRTVRRRPPRRAALLPARDDASAWTHGRRPAPRRRPRDAR